MTDIDITAKTIYGEARGEGSAGMTAVANVIANRVKIAQQYVEDKGHPHPLFGDGTFSDCCQRKYQFSCWDENDPNCEIISALNPENSDIATLAYKIATDAVNGVIVDNTNGATYYYAKYIPAPFWAKGKEPCAVVGNQLFFNNI